MSKWLQVGLGVVTSIGGYLDAGSFATAVQAGAAFRFQLLWTLLFGTLCMVGLTEMAGRLAAVSKHSLRDALHERFGFTFSLLVLVIGVLLDFLVLASEIGGVCLALQLASGISFQWWALPVAFMLWLLLWKGTFGVIQNGFALLGLVTVVFIVAVFCLPTPWRDVAAGLTPSLPGNQEAHYWFIAVSILGATISPYMIWFYSSGAIEDHWDESYLGANRAIAGIGMGFGSSIAAAILIVAALVLYPRGIRVDHYEQAALMLIGTFPRWGFALFLASLAIACFSAALEVALAIAYGVAQVFGWTWGEDKQPREAARFTLVYTAGIFLSSLLILLGVEPLRLTVMTMALLAASLPLVAVPLLLLINDPEYVGQHTNGPLGNAVVIFVIAIAFVLAAVAVPLQITGS
jgi:Mn2+/Fe2+ NRAMP family transporter